MPYPDSLDHQFVVDPTKFDFYSMDCYRHLAEDQMAQMLANEVIRASTNFDGTERAPMRLAEARITLGVVAARQGDLEQAIHYSKRAISAPRKSLPSLLMVSHDLTGGPEQPVPETNPRPRHTSTSFMRSARIRVHNLLLRLAWHDDLLDA